ncbi:MAG: SAF domain-containing protein [Actinomycetota bacterium]
MTDIARQRIREGGGAPPAAADTTVPRFRPAARRWNRIAIGLALGALAIAVNLVVYANVSDSESVVQVVVDVPAGEQLEASMLRTVEADLDSSVNVVAGSDLDSLIGSYARVRLVSGSLVTPQSVQARPLVSLGNAVVAIQVADGSIPAGLRERVPVELVVPARDLVGEASAPTVVAGRVVGLPTETTNALGTLSVSVEVEAEDAATIAAADDVRIVLVEPAIDPAVVESEEGE